MRDGLTAKEFQLFRDYIREQCEINVGDDKAYLIASRLENLVFESGCENYEEFYHKAKADGSMRLRDKIVDAMTTNETLWFRDKRPWLAFDQYILPRLCKQLSAGEKSKIRIWSAGCSTGQEPYSMSMMIHNHLSKNFYATVKPTQFEIVATDLSPSALFIAQSGRYDPLSMSRGMTDEYKDKFFQVDGRVSAVVDEIKRNITFKRLNLLESFALMGKFDLLMCRNVAIYFSHEFKVKLFAKFANAIQPNGFFFLGSAESLLGISNSFEMIEYEKGVFYQLTSDKEGVR